MAKRMQEQKEDNRIVAKSKPTAMNLFVSVSTSPSSVNTPIPSKSPGKLKTSSRQIGSSGKLGVRVKRNSNPDAASSSQGWQRDALLDLNTGKPVATEKRPEVPESSGEHLHGGTCSIWTENIQEIWKLQKIQKNRNPKVEFGHIISMYHLTVYLTWRKSSRL